MALSANRFYKTKPRGAFANPLAIKAANGVTLYAGALVVSRADGYANISADAAGDKFEGIVLRKVTGDTSATPNPEAEIDASGPTLEAVSVTGAAAQSDVNSLVYLTSDDTLTLSATTNLKAVGRVTRWYSGTTCDVKLFTPEEHAALN
jgi:hypothetical protein